MIKGNEMNAITSVGPTRPNKDLIYLLAIMEITVDLYFETNSKSR